MLQHAAGYGDNIFLSMPLVYYDHCKRWIYICMYKPVASLLCIRSSYSITVLVVIIDLIIISPSALLFKIVTMIITFVYSRSSMH